MDGKSRDLTADYIEKIKALFPEAVTEVADKNGEHITQKVDMEKLAILFGEAAIPTDETEYRNKYGEKFSFEWAGKRMAIAEAQKRSTGTLRPCPNESLDWDTTGNLYIEGDNLEVLKLLQDSYLGAIKMIYIDPPYNTGKDFVYKDNYKDNLANYMEQTNTTNAVNSEASGRYHTNWLNMMYPRLKLARNLLTDDGVIFISIDDNEVANLKEICDEIYGADNFIAQIIWERAFSPINLMKHFSPSHDYILCYSKNINLSICKGVPRTNDANDRYMNLDNDPRGVWSSSDISVGPRIEEKTYPITTPSGRIVEPPAGRCWRLSRNAFLERLQDNRIWFGADGDGVPRIKRFLSELRKDGMTPMTIWKYSEVGHSQDATQKLKELFDGKMYFDYPKPVALIKRCIELYTDKDSIILDFFSGSSTTAHSVIELNAESESNRKFIMVQLPEAIVDTSIKNDGYNNLCEIAKERIRRAGKKILEEQKKKNEGLFAGDTPKLDIGFKVFKLDRSNVKNWEIELDGVTEQEAAENLKLEFNKTLEMLKDGRTEMDMLYEVMLKLGLTLTTAVEEKMIDGKRIYLVGNGVMVASFDKEMTYKQIGQMLDFRADFVQPSDFKVVLADESFASDNDKTNVMQLFKQRGITNVEII
jgi:adenine-specific DNA-methyltransferase